MKSESETKNLGVHMKTKLNLNNSKPANLVGVKNFSLFSCEDASLKNVMKYIEDQLIFDGLDRVCIVSIIGKSSLKSFNSKANYITDWVGQNLFNSKFKEKTGLFKDNFVQIDGYYDVNNRMILLHLTSIFDTWAAVNVYEDLEKQFIDKGFLTIWPNLLIDLIKSLLLLFYVSNIMIIANPIPRFDIGCINMLRIVDSTRIKLQPFVSEMLSTFNKLSTNLAKGLCIPQVLFIFEAYDGFDYITDSNIKFFVKQLEEQIVRLLRKTRLINSLFTISSLNSFVFIATKTSTIIDYDEYFFEKIFERCSNDNKINETCSEKYQQTVSKNMSFSNFILPHINSIIKNSKDNGKTNELAKAKIFFKIFSAFKELIFKQTYSGISNEKTKNLQKILDSLHSTLDIDNRFSEGRCSKMHPNAINYYKDNLPSHYSRETHERKLMLTLQHFTVQSRGPAIYKYIKTIQNDCNLFWTNGHKMCEELSLTGNHCINKVHRLPHDDYSSDQLQIETTEYSETSQNNVPIMFHNSMIKIISACDCGRRQGNREDPFTVKAANHDFYFKMRYKCHTCRSITRFKFYVYDSNVEMENLSSSQNMISKSENLRESPLMKTFSEAVLSQDEFDDKNDVNDSRGTQQNELLLSIENLSNNGDSISLNNDENYNYFSNMDINDNKIKNDNPKINGSKPDENQKSCLNHSDENNEKSQSSSASQSSDDVDEDGDFLEEKHFLSEEEFLNDLDSSLHSPTSTSSTKDIIDVKTLPSMIHTLLGNENNLPTRFSSWSLVCFGSSRIYSHNLGIQDQQGFVKGSHYLLPWNVTVTLQHCKNMPLWEGKRPPGIKHKKTVKDGTQFTVKIFIGVEYECFNGHRFIASKPGQVLNASTYKFKETADSIAKNDMPLYMHCVCSRSGKTCVAQLMRIHIVTPKAPIHVTLNPMIQVNTNNNLKFYPGNKEPIKLSQSSYWVLRLPMIYETGSDGAFRFPKEPLPYCRLLKGCYGIYNQKLS